MLLKSAIRFLLFRKAGEQLGLFDVPVPVKPYVRDGKVIAGYVAKRKKRIAPKGKQPDLFGVAEPKGEAVKLGRLGHFIEKHGGYTRLHAMLQGYTDDQRNTLLDSMAKLAGKTRAEIVDILANGAKHEAPKAVEGDLFGQPEPEAPKPESAKAKEPWEMTREAYFNDQARVRHDVLGAESHGYLVSYEYESPSPAGPFRGSVVAKRPAQVGSSITATFGRARVVGNRKTAKQGTPDVDLFEEGKAYHRRQVADALAAGKPVPAHVLADYPDLQAPKDNQGRAASRAMHEAPKAESAKTDDPRQRAIEAVKAGKIAMMQYKNARGGTNTAFGVIDGNTVYSKPSAYSLGYDPLGDGKWRQVTADEYDLWLKEYVDRGREGSRWHGSALDVMALAEQAERLVSEGKKREAEWQSAEHQSLIAKYRLPADTTFRQDGKFLNAGKWRAVGGGNGSGYQDTPEAAAQELRQWIDGTEAGKKEKARHAAATQALVGKLKTGENPSFEEWKAVFPDLKPNHTYLRQPEISPLLIEHFGFSRNGIRAGLGRAAGYLESDTGATYPIVYFSRLADVLGGNKDNQGRDLNAVKRAKEQEAQRAEEGRAASRAMHEATIKDVPLPDWTTVNGQEVLRSGDSKFVAAPRNGKRTAANFDVLDMGANEHVLTLPKDEVYKWLHASAKTEFEGKHGRPAGSREPQEGDTKTEDGIEYRLTGGRWHRTTPDEKPAFQPTHELPDGTQVVAHADEANVWVDAQGDEYESEEAYPIEAERAGEPVSDKDRALAEMLRDNVEAMRGAGRDVPQVKLDKLAELEAKIGAVTPDNPKEVDIKPAVDMSGWSDSAKAAHALSEEYKNRRLDFLTDKTGLAAFKRKIRATAKTIPEDDDRAVMLMDLLVTRVWGNEYDPKQKPVEYGQAPEPANKPANEYVPGSSNPFEVRPVHDAATPFGVQPGTTKGARRKLNAACIDILQKGDITDADRETLRQYSGNGGCGDSLNEFYTSPEIAASMWQVVNQLGVTGGTVLEPSSGPGVFLHTATPGVRVTAVELDSTSANIAQVLHGDRHEIHNASLERFATTDDRQFDAVIGNAPFGPRGALLGDDKRDLGKAEEYFLDTALDKTKPAGIVAMIVPTGIMDSKNGRAFRERLLRKAEFLGAQRMPNSAFEHSHTDVTTDVVYFRKRPDAAAGALSVVDRSTLQALGVWDDEFLSGTYFEGRGAGNLFGRVSTAKRAFGEIYTVEGSMQGIPEALREFTAHPVSTAPDVMEILAALTSEKAKAAAMKAAETRPYANAAKVGDTKVVDGITYVLQGQPPRWHRVDEANMSEAVIEASDIAQRIDALMSGEDVDRGQLETDIKAWVGRHGVPAKNANLMIATATDKTLYRLIGAVGKDGELSDAVRGVRRQIEGSMAAVAHSLALSRRSGVFTAEELAATMGKESDEIQDHLIADPEFAWTGDDQWTTRQAYLTGELWPKLDAARAALDAEVAPDFMRDKLKSQIQALEESIGSKPLDDVDIAVNSAFIPLEIVSAYFTWKDQEGPNANKWTRQQKPVEITFADGVYTIAGGSHWGMKLVDKYLNRSGVKKDEIDDINAMNEDFKAWLCQSEYREQVEELYNRKFLGFVEKDYSKEPIEVPGLANQDQLRDYQWPGLRWALERGKGIIAADVGLGKTPRGLLLARMAKLNGSAQKPIIVVPKSVLANWYAETQKWFPGSRVLTIGGEFAEKGGLMTGKDDNAAERKRKYHDLSQNDYDFVLISEPAFEELDLDPVKKKQMHDRDFWVQRGDKLGNAGDKTVRKIRENYEQAIAKRDIADRTDAMYFNDLGVDMIVADEMHHQKNLYAARSRFGESPKFLGGQGQSQRSLDFNLKARWLLENNGNKGVYGLTATPSKNSPLEIYSMLSHVAPEAFENIGVRNSEEFLDRFALFERGDILDTKSVIAEALITAGFKNLGELRSIMNRYIDKTTAADVGLKLPDRDDRMHFLDMTEEQQSVYEELRQQLEESAGKKDATGDAHIFSIMDKMNKAALDLEILDPETYAGANSPKYDKLAANLMEFLPDGGQVVFSDFIDSHEKIAQALVRQGIPRNQIGILNAQVASSSAKRQQIADAFNAGKLRVVIGNTAVMGEGINLQKSTTDIHHLDLPWEPASIQQRNGRGLRQGNSNEAVRIHTYLAKGSFDGYRYQSIAAKKDWQDILWHGADKVENLAMGGKVSRDELMIMMSADPEAERAKREADQEGALSRLAAQRTEEATGEFIRFQSLKASYKALKSKENRTAALLQDRINKSRNALRGNKYFKAKSALDMDEPVLLHPVTGDIIAPGMRIDLGDGSWVVTAVDVPKQTATARRYGQSAALSTTFKVHQESFRDAVVTLHDEQAENAEMRERMEREAAEKPISSMDELFKLPRSYVEANQEQLQRTAWDGAGDYRFSTRLSGTKDHAVMLNLATGKPELVPYWDIGKKATAETHRFVMPTEADQATVEQAWMNAERAMKHGTKLQSTGRRNSRPGKWIATRKYAEASATDESGINPWTAVLSAISGDKEGYYGEASLSVKAIQKRFAVEQVRKAMKAKTFREALDHMAPLGEHENPYEGHSTKVVMPTKGIMILWAKAKREGILDQPIEPHVPQEPTIYNPEKMQPKHTSYFVPTERNMGGFSGKPITVREALAQMASNKRDAKLTAILTAHDQRKTP